jgi:glucose-6-phosphate 1-dehydrogenase
LSKKKIFPTLWWLYRDGLLPDQILFVGYARTNLTLEQLRKSFEKNCKVRENETAKFEDFIKRITYVSGLYDKDDGFIRLKQTMDAMEERLKSEFFERFCGVYLDFELFLISALHLHKFYIVQGPSFKLLLLCMYEVRIFTFSHV